MAITTYAELKTAVCRWLANDDSGTAATLNLSSTIDDLVTIAEARIFKEARTKDLEAALSASISSGVLAVPTDYVEMKHAYVDAATVQKLTRKPAEWIYENYPTRGAGGRPIFFARESTNFIFGPYPDSAYTVKGVYYKRLAALSSAVHALFTNNPDLYLFAALAESQILIDQKRIPLWEAKYKQILKDLNDEAMGEEFSGSQLSITPG
jgi:hypothetical protein